MNQQRGMGTNLNVGGNANLYTSPNGNTRVDGNANYNRQFGGPFPRKDYNVGVGVSHRF